MKRCVIKRPKHSSSITDETKQDIISKLPEALLTHILSLLPDSDACRTSILSKRWRDLWMFLPNLHLVMPLRITKEQVYKFHDFVDNTLAIRDGMSIQKFLLTIGYCSKRFDYNRFNHWLRMVVQCKIEVLVLKFLTNNPIYTVRFCWDLLKTCNTLVELTLEGKFRLNVPKADVLFPRLKKISLIQVTCLLSQKSLKNLITGCPILEELSLEGYAPTDNLRKLKDPSSQSLTRLKISSTSKFEVEIHKYLYMQDYCVFPTHILEKPLSFVEVYDHSYYPSCYFICDNIAEAKILTLTNSSLEALVFRGLDKHTFPNPVKLTIDNVSDSKSLLVLLNSMPNLEHITILDRISHNMNWIPPMEPPPCLHSTMKEIIILNRKTVSYEEFTFVRYLLEHSKNLVRFKIHAHVLDPLRRKQLLNFHHGLCRIEIV